MTFGEYQKRAHGFSYPHGFIHPLATAETSTFEEAAEITFSGINIARFPMLYGFGEIDEDTTQVIAGEFGSVLWFISEDTTRRNHSLNSVAKNSLRRNAMVATVLEDLPMNRFDNEAIQNAGSYTVVDHQKRSRLSTHLSAAANIKLEDSPGYVLQRVLGRLIRKLHPPHRDCGTQTGSVRDAELDPEKLVQQSPEDALWVMSWVGQTMLNASLDEITQSNIQRLSRRAPNGILLNGNNANQR